MCMQNQLAKLQTKLEASEASIAAKEHELAQLKHALAGAQQDVKQAQVSGPQVDKLKADLAAAKEQVRQVTQARAEVAAAQEQSAREAGHAEGEAEAQSAQLAKAKVLSDKPEPVPHVCCMLQRCSVADVSRGAAARCILAAAAVCARA